MVLMDTNILTRLAQPPHSHHQTALSALAALRSRGNLLCVVPQVLYEFWVVCTRPAAQNGLGLTAPQAQTELSQARSHFQLLADVPAIYPAWEQLVVHHLVVGKNAHDARLVAAMQVHGIAHLLTFNAPDFKRFAGITALSPFDVLQGP